MKAHSLLKRVAAGVAGGALLGAGAAWLCQRYEPRLARTMSGPALIYSTPVLSDASGSARHPGREMVRVLRTGPVFQSATYVGPRCFEPVFEYYRSFDAMFAPELLGEPQARTRRRRVLLLGGGGFAYPKHLLTTARGIDLDVVEIDPAMVDLARRYFYLDALEGFLATDPFELANTMRVFVTDARAFLSSPYAGQPQSLPGSFETWLGGRDRRSGVAYVRGHARYDVIVNDCFAGAEPVRGLATLEAARAAYARLVPGGAYLANIVSRQEGLDVGFLRDVVATLSQVFANIYVVSCSDERFGGEDNFLVVATDSQVALTEAIPFDESFLGEVLRQADLTE